MLQTQEEIYDDGYLRVEYDHYYVACRNVPIYSLSRKEFFVLTALLRGNGRPVRYQDLWRAVWGEADEVNVLVLRTQVANLRRKLTPYGIEIVSMIGVGYYLQIRPREAG
jgi:DNA-binding response OmpR family regulator